MEMTEGNLWKQIFLYSVPLMFTNLLQVLFNLADVAVAGKFAGTVALGAVGSTTLLITLTTGLLTGISSGVNVMTAMFLGADDRQKVSETVHTGFIICLGTGFIVAAAGIVFSDAVLKLLGTKSELIDEARLYFRIYMLGSPALGLYNYGNAVLSAAGDTKKPLRILTAAGVLNVILNLIFVIGFDLSAAGVGIASVISQYLSAVLIMEDVLRTKEKYRLELAGRKPNRAIARRILAVGVPAALQLSVFSIANLFVQSAVNTFDHVTVEGNSAAMNSDSIVYEMMAAFYLADSSFVAQNYGAGKKDRVMQTYLITTLYSFAVGLGLGLLVFAFRRQFLGLFTNDAGVIEKGLIRLSILSLSYWISAFMDNATAGARGLEKTVVPTLIVFLGSVVFRVAWICTVFAHFRTLQSLYLLYASAFFLTSIAGNIYFFRSYRKIFGGK